MWYADHVIRYHPRYWRLPLMGDDTMPPLPPIPEVRSEEGRVKDVMEDRGKGSLEAQEGSRKEGERRVSGVDVRSSQHG
jgi:hypothetical protein